MTEAFALQDSALLEECAQEYDRYTILPDRLSDRPFIVGVVGNIGAGKTTLARLLHQQLQGSVIVQANSARFLLRERGLSWGENVRTLSWEMTRRYSNEKFIPIVDGGTTERGARDQLCRIAAAHGVPLWFIRLTTRTDVCIERTVSKYSNTEWVSNFGECRIGSVQQMEANVRERAGVHDALRNEDIEGLVEVVYNEPVRAYITRRARDIAEELRTLRRSWRPLFM